MRNIIVLSILTFLFVYPSISQIESTKNLLIKELKSGDKNQSIYTKTLADLKQAEFKKDFATLAELSDLLGYYHRQYGQVDSAKYYYQLAVEKYTGLNNLSALADVHLSLEDLYNNNAQFLDAMNEVFAALKIYERLNDKVGISTCYAHLCDLLYYQNKYNEGIRYCDMAIAIQEELNDPATLALSYKFKAINQLFSGDNLDEALFNVNKAIELYVSINEQGALWCSVINSRGNILKYMGRYEEAMVDYSGNYKVSLEQNLDRVTLASLANMGHVMLLQGKYEKALPYNLEAIAIMKATGKTKNLWENYRHVSEMYEKIGQTEKSLTYYKLYSEEHDKYLNSIIDRLETEAQVKYEAEKRQATIDSQNAIIAEQQKIQLLSISLGVLLLAIVFGLIYFYRKRQKQNQALQNLNTDLDKKNVQNELLLKEIHHRVKNNLELVKSLIALQSAQLDDGATKDAMVASQNRVQSMGIIHQKLYQGENLASIEMKDYFLNLGDGILDTFDATDRVKIACAMENLELDVDTAVPIGLIVNELLTNALKYAFPDGKQGEIKVSLKRTDLETLQLQVVDNGIGKNHSNIPIGTGFGSQLIHLLTIQLNGTMQESSDRGMSVTFQFKLKNAA